MTTEHGEEYQPFFFVGQPVIEGSRRAIIVGISTMWDGTPAAAVKHTDGAKGFHVVELSKLEPYRGTGRLT